MKKYVGVFLLVILIFSIVLTGCTKETPSGTTGDQNEVETTGGESSAFKAQITFNGSSTLAPVISAIATDFIEEYTTWDKVDSKFPAENIAIYVSAGGSGAGVKAVLEATSDFGMLAREIKDEENQKIGEPRAFTLGIDALTISVNPENPLVKIRDNLTMDEVKKIFAGEYKYWDEIDSSLPHKEMVVVIRDLGGGAHEVFQKSVMGDTDVREDAIQAPSMGALVTKVIENKDAIGYASFGMVNQNIGKLIPLKVDEVEASKENIASGLYKISRPLIAVKKGDLSPEQQAFVDVLISEKGSAIIEQMGYVPVN